MDSISTARNFFINQQGLSSDQADSLISKGLEAYNQQSQPQTMMQMASNGGRIGYQFGGQTGTETMPMDFGQSLQVNNQGQGQAPQIPNYSSAQSITTNPLLNYGQSPLGAAGGAPLTMNRGGIARLGYQEGGATQMVGTDMSQMAGQPQMDPQQALTIILKMLIDNGVPPDIAQKLAIKIIELFTQGGEQAVLDFADQIQQQGTQGMASGGVAGYARRKGYFLGGIGDAIGDIVGGIGDAIGGAADAIGGAVKSIANSTIGKMALTVAAVYFGGPMLASGLGISGAAGAALAGGLANSALQIASGKGFNPLEALIAAGGAYAGAGGFSGSDVANAATTSAADATSKLAEANMANYVAENPVSSAATAQQLTNPAYFSPTESQFAGPITAASNVSPMAQTYFSPTESQFAGHSQFSNAPTSFVNTGEYGIGYATPKPNLPYQLQGAGTGSTIDMNAAYNDYSYPGTMEKVGNYGTDLINKARSGIQNLSTDPLGTISDLASSAYKKVSDNVWPLATGFLVGSSLGGPKPIEDNSDKKRQEEINKLLSYYGRNLNITNPEFYTRYGARNPFETAAQGGIMGYKQGGSMVPPARQIEGGVIELDARKTGGYIPYGKKERHDDVPAMLAKDEFVFTSKAVKAAGGGDARRGAAKMYALMRQLEGART